MSASRAARTLLLVSLPFFFVSADPSLPDSDRTPGFSVQGIGREFPVLGSAPSLSYDGRPRPRSRPRRAPRVPSGGAAPSPPSALRGWIDGHRDKFPGLKVRTDPRTTLKLRKRFRPLKTVLTLGADFETQLGVWQFKSSWEDSLIGGRLTLNGRELQMSKTWLLSVGEPQIARLMGGLC
uniref:Uncharacterized protein n=1 Tax=Corethron hystrix TaxID=216773 RepID=A0A7S1BH41_9STRA